MKILITDIHHGNGGGHVTYILSLLQGLRSEHDITLAVPPTGRLYRKASEMAGLRVVPGLYTSRLPTLLREVRALRAFLEAGQFDVIHVNGGSDHRHVMLATLGMKNRPGIVWTKHNTNSVSSVGHRLRAQFGTHASIAVCEYVSQILQSSAYRHRPIQLVRNGIDIQTLSPASEAEKNAYREALFGELPRDTLVLGSIGGTDHNKGWNLLLAAAARLPDTLRGRLRFVIAGDPPAEPLLKSVQESGLHTQTCFPGLVSDIRKVLGACDVGFVLSYREAASYASCETMAMGLPALVSDAGGLPENVRPGVDGWVVPVGDVDAIEAVLREILEQPETLQKMGMMARQRVEDAFSMPQFIQDTKAVYQRAFALARKLPSPL